MRGRNLYKDIVVCAAIVLLAAICGGFWKAYQKEQKVYGLYIQSDQELTGHTAAQLQNIAGLCRFEPEASVLVTMKLEEFTLEATLAGVDLESYPLRWEEAKEAIALGNTLELFFGAEVFQMFSDKHGYRPDKKQVETWIAQYQGLPVSVTDGSGHTRRGRVSGILKSPSARVFMDKSQMEGVFKGSCQVTGGYLEVYGYKNKEKAKNALESGGFLAEEGEY